VRAFEADGAPDRYLSVRGTTFPGNRAFFAPIKDLRREPTEVEARFDGARVHLRADAYAYFVHLAHPDERVRFSDNYLELEPGEERTIELSEAAEGVSVRSR